ALLFRNGVIGADRLTLSALDTFGLVDKGFPIHKGDGPLRTDLHTGVGQTALAHVADVVSLLLTGLAGRRDHLHGRRLIIFVGDIAGLSSRRKMDRLVLRAQGQSHGQPESLADDSPGSVHALPVLDLRVLVYHFIWN